MYITRFSVEGGGSFPLDMLRYDACYPESERDAKVMRGTYGVRMIALQHRGTNKFWTPNKGRWESFGWTVVPDLTEHL